jgi:uridine phosphorylase
MNCPIVEFDPEREAFIEPSKVIKPRNVPEHCVITFFSEVIEKVVAGHQAKLLVENRWEDGPHPLYEIEYIGQRLAFFHPGIGAALSASLLEEVIAFGCRKFFACGGSGDFGEGFGCRPSCGHIRGSAGRRCFLSLSATGQGSEGKTSCC